MCSLLPDLVANVIVSYLEANMAMHLSLACRQWAGVVRRTLPHHECLRLVLEHLWCDQELLREEIEEGVTHVLGRIPALGEWLSLGCHWQKRHHHYHEYVPLVWHPGNTMHYKLRYPRCLSSAGLLWVKGSDSVCIRRMRLREVYYGFE